MNKPNAPSEPVQGGESPRRAGHGGAFFFALTALALVMLTVLVFLLGPGARPETPAVILAAPVPAENGESSRATDGTDNRILTVDVNSIQNVVATLSRAENYSRVLTATTYWNGGSSVREITVWVHGAQARLRIREGGSETEQQILLRDGKKWIWYSDRPGVWTGRAALGDTDAYQTLRGWEEILTVDRRSIIDAGCTVYNGTLCVYARYAKGSLGYESLSYIAVDSGLLMGAETYDGDTLIYSLSSTSPVFSTPDEAVFEIPEV
ncbi:MAG: hypothetical protein IJ617_04485 [Oscillospiraceae bacterium]|nr:hypothetical protein [Oscillospiraceae bacterium]